jgi:hypothetical protein
MRSFTYVALFAGAAVAETAVIFSPFLPHTPLRIAGNDKGVTTYVNECPAGKAGLDPVSESKAPASTAVRSATNVQLTAIPSPPATTAAARLRRADDEDALCEPYTLKQGSETWEFHMTDPTPGQLTIDASCNWKGDMATADIMCTVTNNGAQVDATGVITDGYKASEVKSNSAIQTVSITSAAAGDATNTASGSGAKDTAAASASVSGSGAPSPSAAGAASGPLPTGAMAFVGGAAGILAAAFAL